MEENYKIISPENTYIEEGVTIGKGSIIHPFVTIQKGSVIGENVEIKGNTRIKNTKIGNGTIIDSSVIEDSIIGENVKIGPFAHLRPNSNIANNCKIGNFVEIKNANLGEGTKASHLAYVGDADIGKNVNIGCGVIFVNYDGAKKFRSKVEDGAFIGSNSNIVAPVHINENAYIAAGSTITIDIPKDALAIARSREYIKKDFVRPKKD